LILRDNPSGSFLVERFLSHKYKKGEKQERIIDAPTVDISGSLYRRDPQWWAQST